MNPIPENPAEAGMSSILIPLPGQVYRFDATAVEIQTGKAIGPRWFVVVQTARLAKNDRILVALITGKENKPKRYPWQAEVSKADAGFLDKDSVVLCSDVFMFTKASFGNASYVGQFSDIVCRRIAVGIREGFLTDQFL